jgi:hypothetical protein
MKAPSTYVKPSKYITLLIYLKRIKKSVNGTITERSVYKKIAPIKRNIIPDSFNDNKGEIISDPRLCVIDLETYKDMENQVSKVYAAGLNRNGYPPILFYIDKESLDSNQVIYNLLDELFKPKYKDLTIY